MSKGTIRLGAAALAMTVSLASVAIAADVELPPEEALSPFSAQVDGWVGYWFLDDEKDNVLSDEDEGLIYGADGKLRLDLFSGLSVQADAGFDDVDENDGEDYYQGGWYVGGHLSWSDPESALLGIFGGTGAGESDEEDTDFWVLGGEAQLYFDNWTLYGQVGYFDAEADSEPEEDAFHDAWFGRIVARYFFTSENRLQAEFAYADGDQDSDEDDEQNMEVISWGARYDHQLWENITIFAAYDGGYYDNGNGFDTGSYYDHVISGGLSISLGRPDLLSIDRSGPNLDMPQIGRWAASGQIVD
jgi:hypothetical protein